MKNAESKNTFVKNDYQMNQEIAEKIIDIIESGNIREWRRTWTTTAGHNLDTIYELVQEGYLAVNVYTLKEYEPLIVPSGFYVTFKQIRDHHLHLNKGAKGIPNYKPAYFYKLLTQAEEKALFEKMNEDKDFETLIRELISGKRQSVKVYLEYTDDKNQVKLLSEVIEWNNKKKKFQYRKFQYVLEYLFQAQDCNLNIRELWKLSDAGTKIVNDLQRIQRVEEVKDSYITRANLKFEEIYQSQAYYRQSDHRVVVPTKNQFETIEDYYQTVLHEFAHSTGHPSLLNRKTLTASCGFASVMYSKEELVAELSSLYTMISLDLMNDRLLENSIAYLKGWGNSLKDGIRYNILNTIAQSRKATNLILGIDENEKALTLSVAD